MILVNNPGSWSHVYPPLLHAEWHGWTPTDLIFPFFLFIVGVAISLSFASKPARLAKILSRSLVLFGLGLFMAAYPRFDLAHLRIPGVLQRIAICYFATSLLVLHASRRAIYATLLALLLGYFLLLGSDLSPEGNLAARIDRFLLDGHLWKAARDPEGFLSTFPAIATTILGYLAGERLRLPENGHEKAAALFSGGWALISRRSRLEHLASNQQEPLDQLLRSLHGGRRPPVSRCPLLARRREETTGVDLSRRGFRSKRDRGLRSLRPRGEDPPPARDRDGRTDRARASINFSTRARSPPGRGRSEALSRSRLRRCSSGGSRCWSSTGERS